MTSQSNTKGKTPITDWSLSHFLEGRHSGEEVLSGSADIEWVPAIVPGNVLIDLQAAEKSEDPYWEFNPEKFRSFEGHEWWYRASFRMPESEPEKEELRLVFEGIDTFAEVFIDGRLLGKTDNAFIPHRFDLKGIAETGEICTLHIRIRSDWNAVKDRNFEGCVDVVKSDHSRLWIRKPAHAHGWDIFPRLLSNGIFKPVYVERVYATRIEDVFAFVRELQEESATIAVRVTANYPGSKRDQLSVKVSICDALGRLVGSATHPLLSSLVPFRFGIESPQLWWPRPMGESYLYRVTAELIDSDYGTLDAKSMPFGIRTIEICQDERNGGRQSFYFKINNKPISVFGTNLVPLDALHSRSSERLPRVIELLDESRCNMVRVWGGGVYEDDEFYEACDRLGIMVWQDFAFACAIYPQQQEFLEEIRKEAATVIRKLRNHPSIVLWCGDNEVAHCCDGYFGPSQEGGNRRISNELLPDVCVTYDGTRPYWPSSPWSGVEGIHSRSDLAGDVHIWCHGLFYKDRIYSENEASFISEIGHLAFCNEESIKKFMSENRMWPIDEALWGYRFGSLADPLCADYRLQSMYRSIRNLFGQVPDTLQEMILASQIVQAEALKYWIEHCRRKKFDCGGILWWNLIDGWPQFSDALVDYYFEKKIAFGVVKRSQSDLLICLNEVQGQTLLYLVNDTQADRRVSYSVQGGKQILIENEALVPANSVIQPWKAPENSELFAYYLKAESEDNRYWNHFLAAIPPIDLRQYQAIVDFYRQIE